MTGQSPRIPPLEPPYTVATQAALSQWMPPNSPVEPLGLFRTLLVHKELANRMRPLGAGILGATAKVPAALREVMIHRTCALTGAEYEWGVHVMGFGKPLGLSDEQLHSTVYGSHLDPCWDSRQAAVFGLADELHRTSAVSQGLWRALIEQFDHAQILELLVTAGWYHTIGYVCNGLQIQQEEWAARFPAKQRASPPGR
jgi:4-carboxymuconolactone decarboxylase